MSYFPKDCDGFELRLQSVIRTVLFEVGGRKKSFEQIKDIPDSYLAVDDIETGHGNRIPLWMFGLLY